MTYEQEYRDELEKAHKRQTATKLFDGIRKLYSSESSPRRWIWELLQNAKDVAGSKVKVEIILNKDFLEFKHNGRPFLMKNITYLIEQVSTKDRNSNKVQDSNNQAKVRTTGKFGTGFMTTHLLSKKVELTSVFEDPRRQIYKRFQLSLDRSATTVEEMIAAVNEAADIRRRLDDEEKCPTLPNYKLHQSCDTTFRYALDKEGLKVATIGIQDLYNAIIYTLVFIPEIESVLVQDIITNKGTHYQVIGQEKIDNIRISHIEQTNNGTCSQLFIASCSKTITLGEEEGEVSIAIELNKQDNKYSVAKLESKIPLLFCDFPLIGSETKFKCPVVINSPLLEPTEPRDSILLDDRVETGGRKNREIFTHVISLYNTLLDYGAANWLNVHLLVKSGLPKNLESQWYEAHIQSLIRAKALETPIVRTNAFDQPILLKNALIPYCSKNLLEFWDLAIWMHPDKLPQKQHVKDWYDIISSDNGWSKSLPYDLQRLLADIHKQKNLQNLCVRLESNEPNTLDWLNKVIAFVFESNQSQLLSTEYAILPNQYGEFQLKTNLAKDEGIPEGLKDVLILLGQDWKKELLHLGTSCTLEKTRNIRGISERISALITEKTSPNLREAAYLLISYIPDTQTTSTKQARDQDISGYRRKIWEFAASLDKDNVPEIKTLSNWTPSLWDICDEWILKTLIKDIVQLKQVSKLQTTLETETELETVDWLSNFISFLRASKKESLCSEQPIFPNQLGIFKKKAELLFDKNIPEQLKDVLELFGSPCRSKLLHKNILGYNTSIEQLRVSDVSKQINDIIRDEDTNQSHEFKSAIYSLISLFATDNKEQNRVKIWQYARDIFADVIPEKVFIDNLDDFSWKECNTWIITGIVEEVEETNNLDCLANLLLFNKEDTISWLNNLLCFINNNYQTLLDDYALMPTQHEHFKTRKELKKDGGIPEELKEIARYLKLQEWNDFLLLKHPNFQEAQKLIDESNIESLEDIATEIDKTIRDYGGDKENNSYREVVKQLLHWSSSIPESDFKRHFTYFYEHRAEIVLQTLGDDEVRNNIFVVLQAPPDKLNALADLARNSNITADDLHQLSENLDIYKALEQLKGQLDVEEDVITILADLGIHISLAPQPVSTNFTQTTTRRSYPTPVVIPQEQYVDYNTNIHQDDSPSYGENAERYGQIGEHWARRLYEEVLKCTLLPPDDSGFDLLCALETQEKLRVEVKAITFNKPLIRITVNEWEKMVFYKDSYELLICSHNKGTPQELIRVKSAWSTLTDILACMKSQPLTNASYNSGAIDFLIGLQLKSDDHKNDILVNWHRLFKQINHPNIEKYLYDEEPNFIIPCGGATPSEG